MGVFKVKDVFFLGDGRVVFAGEFLSGTQENGTYELCINDQVITQLRIVGEMQFPSKGTTDIAIYTFDKLEKDQIDLDKNVTLQLMNK